jgi:N-acetyl-anhydromuramyl-L-alanine amidase AmpD
MWSNLWAWFASLLGRTVAEWKTVGPADDEHPIPTSVDLMDRRAALNTSLPWSDGWHTEIRMAKAHPGRIGLPIVPRAIVVHVTDTAPGGFDAIVKSWTAKAGAGNAAHFMIGRTPKDGIVQFVPVTRNGNHAGGKTHGWWRDKAGRLIHPNTCSVGIEIDCGGRLKQYSDGAYYHPTSGKEIPIADVYFDSKGRAWHKPTDYQKAALKSLIAHLRRIVQPMPADWTIVPNGDYGNLGVAYFAPSAHRDLVGHVTLDPSNRSDPGPLVMEWLKEIP